MMSHLFSILMPVAMIALEALGSRCMLLGNLHALCVALVLLVLVGCFEDSQLSLRKDLSLLDLLPL